MMFALRRWWNRYAVRAGTLALVLGAAWGLRQNDGVLLYEFYNLITSPFQPGLSQQQQFENSYILELQQRVVELENQNRRLQGLRAYQQSLPTAGTTAAVIGREANHWWKHAVVNVGSTDGIAPGYVVTGPGGLVGRVSLVSPHTSRILMISDPTIRVGAMVSRSRAMGVVRGQSENRVVMEFFGKFPEVSVGDVVVTSPHSRLYPAGVPIGRVEAIDLTSSPAPTATILLSAPLPILEWVVVHPFEPRPSVDDPLMPGQVDGAPDSSAEELAP